MPLNGISLKFSCREKIEAAEIRERRAVAAPIAVEAYAPDAAARQAGLVGEKAAIGEVGDHDDVVARAAQVPAVVADELVLVVDVMPRRERS